MWHWHIPIVLSIITIFDPAIAIIKRDFKFAALVEGAVFLSCGLRQMFAKYYFSNPAHVTLPNPRRPLVSVSSRSIRHNALVGGHPGPRKKADENSSTR